MVLNFNIHSLNNASDEGLAFNFWKNTLNVYGGGDTPYYIKTLSKTLLPFNFTSAGFDLINYEIFGNSVQDGELYSSDLWQDGFINSSGSADPVTNSAYPNAKYFKIALKQGQVVRFTVEPNDIKRGRGRYIDPETNTVQGTIGLGTNKDYVSSTNSQSGGFRTATFTALQDVTLAFMDLEGEIGLYTTFSLITDVSPSSPLEVESVGEKTKNKLKIIQGITIDSTTGNEKTSTTAYASDYIPAKDLLETNNLCFTTNVNGLYNFIWAYNKNKEAIKRTGGGAILTRKLNAPSNFSSGTGSGTADTEIEYIRVCFYPNAGATGNITFDNDGWAQLEDGSQATSYEPYGYKIPVKVSGKNLFNLDELENAYPSCFDIDKKTGYVKLKSWDAQLFTIGIPVNWKTGTIISFTPVKTGEDMYLRGRVRIQYQDGTYYNFNVTDTEGKINPPQKLVLPQNVVSLKFDRNTHKPDYFGFTDFMVSEENIPFEPYSEPTTTNIYLDEPLRKIGDYADVIDFENQKVVRNITSSAVTVSSVPATKLTGCSIGRNTTFFSSAYNNFAMDLASEYFTCVSGEAKYNIPNQLTRYNLTQQLMVCIPQSVLGTTDESTNAEIISAINNWTSSNDVKVYYPLVTPTEEAIQLPPIETSEGINVFDIETKIKPSKVTITYYSKDKDGTVTANID